MKTLEVGDRVKHRETGAKGTVVKLKNRTASVDFDRWTMPGGKHTLPRQTLDAKKIDLIQIESEQ